MVNGQPYEKSTEALHFETLLTNLSTLFINYSSTFVKNQIENGLRLIIEFLGAEKGVLASFEQDSRAVSIVANHSISGVEFESLDLSSYFTRAGLQSMPAILKVDDLTEGPGKPRGWSETSGIKTCVIIPIKLPDAASGAAIFVSKHEITHWPGDTIRRLALLGEMLGNVLGRMRADEQNIRLLSFEKLLSRVSTNLINLPVSEIDREIQRGLETVVKFLGVDRGTVFQFSPDMARMNRTHSYAEEGILSSPLNYQTEALPWTAEKLQRGELILLEKIEDLPAEAAIDREVLVRYGIESAVTIPMIVGGSVLGSVSVSTIGRKMEWPRSLVDRLKVIGDIFASALARKRGEELLHDALDELTHFKEQLEAENVYLRKETRVERHIDKIVGHGAGLKHALFRASQAAQTDTTVLILGETGTGKELMSIAIHNMSPRKDRPLITVNCAALPPDLIESELFGHEKGAFTGADARQMGRFEIAHNSSLCLDEIGELPFRLQSKLLRVIQDGEFQRLGSPHTHKVDVRIIATTNRNLEEEVRKGRFRQDLFYRLNVFPVMIPPLRERREDIPLLVETFVARYSRKLGKKITSVANETMKALMEYPWPGNIRELESVIERSVILCPGAVLRLSDKLTVPPRKTVNTKSTLHDIEREHILSVLSQARWRVEGANGAAAILGLHASTLRSRMRKLGIR